MILWITCCIKFLMWQSSSMVATIFKIIMMFFCGKCKVGLLFFWFVDSIQPLTSCNWGLQSFFACCSCFIRDLLGESLILFWSNFGWSATQRKVHCCSISSPFVDDSFHCVWLEPKILTNDFASLFWLLDASDLVSWLFLNSFSLGHSVLLSYFSTLHVVRHVLFK